MLYGDGREEELSGHMVVELAKERWPLAPKCLIQSYLLKFIDYYIPVKKYTHNIEKIH